MSDLDDKDFAIRAPYIQEIARLNNEIELLKMQIALQHEALGEVRYDIENKSHSAPFVRNAYNSTIQTASDWLSEHDAKVRQECYDQAILNLGV